MALIPLRWQIRIGIALALLLGVLGFARWRVSVAEKAIELERLRSRLDTIKRAGEKRDEIERLDADQLLERSRRWVRRP